jgi:outer membrane protein W
MSRNRRLQLQLAISASVLLTLFSTPGALAVEGQGWRLRIDFGIVDPGGEQGGVEVGGATARVKTDCGAGVGARGEYQFSRWLGVDIGALASGSAEVRASAGIGDIGTAVQVSSFVPLTVGLNVHLIPRSRPDLYIGPLLAYSIFSDVGVQTGLTGATSFESVDNDLGYGAILGLDLPLGQKGWLFNLNLRHIKTEMNGREGSDRIDADYDPTIFAIGFGYRF